MSPQINRIPLFKPPLYEGIQDAFVNAFRSGWWGYGPECRRLENEFTKNRGGWALATSSCTSALFIVAKLLNESTNDEVIVPGITWISTAMAFLSAGFKVKLADVDPINLMIDENTIEPLITKNTKAVVFVHLYGQKGNVEGIRKLCDEKNLILIEDCAHRIDVDDATLPLGDYCCYSFNTVKEVSCGEGGLVWGKNLSTEDSARCISYMGMEVNTWERASTIKHNDLIFSTNSGLKLQLHDLSASVANAMFKFRQDGKAKRELIFRTYEQHFVELTPKISILNRDINDSFLMFVIRINNADRNLIREVLAKEGIATSVHYQSLSTHPLIYGSNTPVADKITNEIITLPCFPDFSQEQQMIVIKSFKNKIIKHGGLPN